MLASWAFKLLWLISFSTCVAAKDDNDDFSNNLFTDLAPILALFGEQVTKQFLSHSTGWADNIILSMAPLGIVTTIVSAIRIGGPSWLKALIGRARENLAVAEAEIMSSVSKEVCELWNGRAVVRCIGTAQIAEFICLIPDDLPENDKNVKITTITRSDAERRGYLRKAENNGHGKKYKNTYSEESIAEHGQAQGANPTHEVVVVRNTTAVIPNISLNAHKQFDRRELHVIATIGAFLQLGVLLYAGFATYYPELKFPKGGIAVEKYAYPCNTIGTVILVTGMLLCSHVVESSTLETTYRTKPGTKARMVWLQQAQTVSDQSFDSYAIFTRDSRTHILTSERMEGQSERAILILKTIFGSIICISGFIIQFVGLRAMHWSVSVAQLGSVLIMTTLRAWVRRGLTTKSLGSTELPPGTELEYFAMTFGGISKAPWLKGYSGRQNPTARTDISSKRTDAIPLKGDGSQVTTTPIRKRRFPPRKIFSRTEYRLEVYEVEDYRGWEIVLGGGSDAHTKLMRNSELEPQNSHISEALTIMTIRRQLNDLTIWPIISGTALKLIRAIEATMKSLGDSLIYTEYTWILKVRYAHFATYPIHLSIRQKALGKWEADARGIEAAVSLWFYSINQRLRYRPEYAFQNTTSNRITEFNSWKAVQVDPAIEKALWFLGPFTLALLRDLDLWIPGHSYLALLELEKLPIHSDTVGIRGCEILNPSPAPHEVGDVYRSTSADFFLRIRDGDYKQAAGIIAIDRQMTWPMACALNLFSAFMWSVAKSLESPIGNGALLPVNPDASDTWYFKLHDQTLATMVQNIESIGLGSQEDIYYSVIPSLSVHNLLPEPVGLLEKVRQGTKSHEEVGNLEFVTERYLWLFGIVNTFPKKSDFRIKTVVVLFDYLKRLTEALALRYLLEASPFKTEIDISPMETMVQMVEDALKPCGYGLLSALMVVYVEQGRFWKCNLLDQFTSSHITSEPPAYYFKPPWLLEGSKNCDPGWDSDHIRERDIHGWSLLHYASAKRWSPGRLISLITEGAEINAEDIQGWTPLHYACLYGSYQVATFIVNRVVNVNARGRDGATPLHCAAKKGHINIVILLVEFGAEIDAIDAFKNTPLHWAALRGYQPVVEYLWEVAKKSIRSEYGRTVLHLAVLGGNIELVRFLIEKNAQKGIHDMYGSTPLHLAVWIGRIDIAVLLMDPQVDVNAADGKGRTALHIAVDSKDESLTRALLQHPKTEVNIQTPYIASPLGVAATAGYVPVAKLLVEAGADIELKDEWAKETPLFEAVRRKQESMVKYLLDAGANMEAENWEGETPLHVAVRLDHGPIVKLLLEYGANVDVIDEHNKTPLYYALDKCFKSIARLLLDAGARVDLGEEHPRYREFASFPDEVQSTELISRVDGADTPGTAKAQTELHKVD
ncbi:hypothetical protein FQN57_004925 [Myotisia sp. PD_48]|nr:hypothetical protein FQN57_004925 [Myotisia sp. PD_48]